jgi:ABC-2 type transport system ATP-binding protein
MAAAVEVRDLHVVRGRTAVLRDLELDVDTGSVTGLLGPSGSGKTTLLRAIVGVQIVTAGEVAVLGQAAGSPALRPRVGYMTQAPSVYADLSVRENLRYFAQVLDVDLGRLDAVVHTVGLEEHEGQVVGNLSGGERARVSLATALLNEPELLVLDEPTVGLDPVLRRDLWNTFHELAAAGATLLVSSHVMDEAERCDRLILLREGHVLATGTPHELLERTNAPDLETVFLALVEAQA